MLPDLPDSVHTSKKLAMPGADASISALERFHGIPIEGLQVSALE